MSNILLEEGENKVFTTIKEALHEMNLDYVYDLGLRYFYKGGTSFGVCTNLVWKEKKKDPEL